MLEKMLGQARKDIRIKILKLHKEGNHQGVIRGILGVKTETEVSMFNSIWKELVIQVKQNGKTVDELLKKYEQEKHADGR